MSDYPEHDKLKDIQDKSQIVGEFIDWLQYEKNLRVCYYSHILEEFLPSQSSIETLLAEFFDIDLNKIDEEKRRMLEKIRGDKSNEQ